MNHYTYMLIDPISDMKYIGVRSCECDVLLDPYKGSAKHMTQSEKDRCDKLIIKTFDTRQDAMNHEIELHNKYDVAVNPKFWNKCKSTSTGFTMQGVERGPITAEQSAKLSELRKREGNHKYKKTSIYEWVHKSGEVYEGTVADMADSGKADPSCCYKVINGHNLYATGWRIKRNITTGTETSDVKSACKKVITEAGRKSMSEAQLNRERKIITKYLWVDLDGNRFIGDPKELGNHINQVSSSHIYGCLKGIRNFAHGWRIVKNMDTSIESTDLNFGRNIKQRVSKI